MAIQFTDFSRAPLLDSATKNIFEDVLKGYKIAKEPAKMKQEAEEKDLSNKLKSLEVEHKPKEYELNDKQKEFANSLSSKALEHYEEKYQTEKAYKQALTESAKRPAGLKSALANAFQVRNSLNPQDPNYQQDLKAVNNYINKLGTVSGQTPVGEPIKIDLPEGKSGSIQGLGNMPKGWQPVKDDKGNVIGANVPLDKDQVKQWKAKEKFDVIQPFINKSLSYYSGRNSWENFLKDMNHYKYDPDAKQRIDDYLASRKLLSIGTTSENARIGGHATNIQLKELKKTLDSSEVHHKLNTASTAILPKGYAKASGELFKSYLDKVEDTAKNNIPLFEFRALNPGKNDHSFISPATNNESVENSHANSANNTATSPKTTPEILKVENGMATVKNIDTGKIFQIPEKLLDQYMTEHSPTTLGGQNG